MKLNLEHTLVTQKLLERAALNLSDYIQELGQKLNQASDEVDYSFPESSILLPLDVNLSQQLDQLIQDKVNHQTAAILVIGIGGANLGSWAIYDALKYNQINREIIFLETLDAAATKKVFTQLEDIYRQGDHVLLNLISSSGKTTETIANFGIAIEKLRQLDLDFQNHVVVTTKESSPLWLYAREYGYSRIATPEIVGDRYSVLSPTGLLPAGLAGTNIDKIISGAKKSLNECLTNSTDKNPALASATATFLNYQKNYPIHNTFIFEPSLTTFGRWYRQLAAESLGKQEQGILPTISIGTTDLHSMLQLYLGGPKNVMTTFVNVTNLDRDLKIGEQDQLSRLVPDIQAKSLNHIRQTIYQAVKTTYQENRLPFIEISLDRLDEENLGWLLQTKMIEVMFLAKLLKVNPFDQPAVEGYKQGTRALLASN